MVIISRKPKWNGENGESVTMKKLLRNHVERTTFCVINIVYRDFSCIDAFDSIMKVRCTGLAPLVTWKSSKPANLTFSEVGNKAMLLFPMFL
jgi:hypothetical protein